jgi:hypothetical protein
VLSKKRLTLLAAGAASAALFATFAPSGASAQTNELLCGIQLADKDAKPLAYLVAKLSSDDSATCDEAINKKAPQMWDQQIAAGNLPARSNNVLSSPVHMATCDSLFQDFGYLSGSGPCSSMKVSPNPQNVSITVVKPKG